jgi:hypothetical protein
MTNREETHLPDNNEIANILPSMTSPLTNVTSLKNRNADHTPTTIGNDCNIAKVALLPHLGIDLDCFPHDSLAKAITQVEKIGIVMLLSAHLTEISKKSLILARILLKTAMKFRRKGTKQQRLK